MHVFLLILSFFEFHHFHVFQVSEFEDNSTIVFGDADLEAPLFYGN